MWDYLPDDEHGRLIVRERRILINAHKPRYEHIFTVLHEIGHIIMHVRNQNRVHQHPWLHRFWNIVLIDNFVAKVRRHVRMIFNKDSGREWEADLWAMCAFLYVTKVFKNPYELTTFIWHHPEKSPMVTLAAAGVALTHIKIEIKENIELLMEAFKFSSRVLSRLRIIFPYSGKVE